MSRFNDVKDSKRICQTLTLMFEPPQISAQAILQSWNMLFFQVNLIHLPFFVTIFLRHLEKLSDLFEKLRVSGTTLTNKPRHLCQYLSSFVNRLRQLVSVCVPCRKWREELHLTRSWSSRSCWGITWETSRLPRWDALFFCFRTGCIHSKPNCFIAYHSSCVSGRWPFFG